MERAEVLRVRGNIRIGRRGTCRRDKLWPVMVEPPSTTPLERRNGAGRSKFALTVGLLLAMFLIAPQSSLAHATLRSATPPFGTELRVRPARVTLRFDQRVTVVPSAIHVLGRAGADFARRSRAQSTVVTARLRPLPTGAYTVRWRIISADAHVVAGVWTFGVRVPAPPVTAAFGAGGPTLAEHVARWVWFFGVVLAIGSLGVRLLCMRGLAIPKPLDRRIAVTAGLGAVVALQAGIAAFSFRGEDVLQLPFRQFLDGDLSSVAATRFGYAFVTLSLSLAALLALVFLAWLLDRPVFYVPALAIALAAISGFSLSGHDAVDPGSSWRTEAADWVHLSAVSLWLGGLMTMAVVLWRQAPELRTVIFFRFSRYATVAVGLTIGAGVYLSVVRVPRVHDLWQTGYGRILLVKVALVGVALGWGALHHFVVRPRLEQASPRLLARTGISLQGESLIGVVLLLTTAVLVDTKPPPRPIPARSPITIAGKRGSVRAEPLQSSADAGRFTTGW